MKTVIDKLREFIVKDEEVEFDVYELTNTKGWPDIQCDFSEDDGPYYESLDVENWQITEVNEDTFTIMAGGDWQDPLAVTIKINETLTDYNQLEVISTKPCNFHDAEEIDIIKLLN